MKKERNDKQKEAVCEEEKSFPTNKANVDKNTNLELNDNLKQPEISDVEEQQISTSDDKSHSEKKIEEIANAVINTPNEDIGTLTISEYRGFYFWFFLN